MKRLALVLACLFLPACTAMEWTKSDLGPGEAAADMKACREQAWREASWSWGPYGYWYGMGPFTYYDPWGRRLYPWHYYAPYGDPFGGRFMEEARLTDFCMRAKGYELAPASEK